MNTHIPQCMYMYIILCYVSHVQLYMYIGIGRVVRQQSCTFENLNIHFHYAFHCTSEDILAMNKPKGTAYQKTM